MLTLELVALAVLGVVVGYLSGVFGIGGGLILTPLLHALFGVPIPIAVGSGLAQMIAVGIGAAWRHADAGFVDFRLAIAMTPGSVLGTFLGTWLLAWLTQLGAVTVAGRTFSVVTLTVSMLFILLLTGIAVRFWRESGPAADVITGGRYRFSWSHGPLAMRVAAGEGDTLRISLISLLLGGLLVGILAGLLGIGGGVVVVPLLVYGFGISLRTAIGTSAAMILVSAVLGTVLHTLGGRVDWTIALVLMAGSTLGVQVGAWHGHRLEIRRLQRAFAVMILFIAAIVLYRLVT